MSSRLNNSQRRLRLSTMSALAGVAIYSAAAVAGSGVTAELFDSRQASGLFQDEGSVPSRGGGSTGPVPAAMRGPDPGVGVPGDPVDPGDPGGRPDRCSDCWTDPSTGNLMCELGFDGPCGDGCLVAHGVRGGMPNLGAVDEHGVDYFHGHKTLMVTDLTVALTGADFRFVRTYTSDTGHSGAGLIGNNWIGSAFIFLEEVGGGSPKDLRLDGPGPRTITFAHSSGTWTADGATAQSIEESTATIGTDTYATWRLTEPGLWQIDFYRPHAGGGGITATPATHEGLMLRQRDPYGNTWIYDYEVYGINLTTDKWHARLVSITCTTGDAGPVTEAEIIFTWQDNDIMPEAGRLLSIQVMRASFETNRVEYRYKADGDGLSDHLGVENDLIEARSYVRLDDSSSDVDTWRQHVMQYRYHGGVEDEDETDVDVDGFIEKGADHQLKMVLNPEQIEFFAQQVAGGTVDTVVEAAATLLVKGDGAAWFTGSSQIVADLAAEVIASYLASGSRPVEYLYSQSACGCGSSSTQGTRTKYDLFVNSAVRTLMRTEEYEDGASWSTKRVRYTDSEPLVTSGVPYIRTHAAVDPSGTKKWVNRFEYDGSRRIEKALSPEAMQSYSPATSSSAPSYTAKASAGFVYAMEYTSDHRLAKIRMGEGGSGAISSYTLVTEHTYGSGTGSTRKHLPTSMKRYRVAGSSSADDVESIEYTYGFHNSGEDDVQWVEIASEAELVAENGPGGSLYRYETLDVAGRNTWSRAEDKALTKRTFHSGTGAVETVTRNADPTGLPSLSGLSTSGWGRYADGGSLVTTYTRDKEGRVQTVTGPNGAVAYVYRAMLDFSELPGIKYYAEVSMPHIIDAPSDQYGGPATVTVMNAGGHAVGSSSYAIDDFDPLEVVFGDKWDLGTELTRSVVTHDVAGLVKLSEVWHDIANDGSYVTTYDYDTLGRIRTVVSPTGTITRNSYDLFDRVVTVEIGTSEDVSTGDMVAVSETFYDSGGSATQGVGNGKVTLVRRHVDGSTVRDTIYTHDYRGNVVITENELPPHSYQVYDNLDRPVESAVFSSVPSGIATTLADRGRYTSTAYSQRGMVYRQRTAIDATAGSPTFLATHTWRDDTGRPVCEWRPNVPATKMTYDGLGRMKTSYVTTRGGDADPGASGNHADALALTSDLIAEQTTYRYIANKGQMDLVTRLLRAHDASGTGDLTGLGSANSIAMYSASYYDDAGRQVRSVEFGTNISNGFEHGGTAPTITQASPPSPSAADATKLVTSTAYNSRGLVEFVTGPDEHQTKSLYDDMNRRIVTIENYDDATVAWSSGDGRWETTDCGPDDEDRVTSYVYDGMGHVTKLTAHLPDGSGGELVQTTQYVYGVAKGASAGDSELGSFNLLAEIRYPDPSTGDPGSSASDKVFHAYNRLGELIWKEDQDGTIHEYERDSVGRLTANIATYIPSGISSWIDAITTTYDGFGRKEFVHSRDGGVSGTIKNAVKFTYTPLWEVKDLWQDHDSDVDTGGGASNSRKVTYTYTTVAAVATNTNVSRVTRLTYPDGSHFDYAYDGFRRVSEISRLAGGFITVSLVNYQYIGMGIPAVVEYVQPDVLLDYSVAHNGDRTSGEYPGLDRYGRIVRQAWVDGGLTTHSTDGTVPNIPPIVELGYGYDNHGNRTHMHDLRPGAKRANRDWSYSYDGLDRLVEAKRGIHGGSWTYSPGSEKWTLDMLGNWDKFKTDDDGDGDFLSPYELELRSHNFTNEIEDQVRDNDPTDPAVADLPLANQWSASGAAVSLAQLDEPLVYMNYVHDAWGRLVAVSYGANLRAEYEYNGLSWRTVRRSDTQVVPDGTLTRQHTMYYDAGWRLLEERINDDLDDNANDDRVAQQLWGMRFIDDAVMRRIDADLDFNYSDGGDGTWWYVTDAVFSVVAVVDNAATLVERVNYTPYGVARHQWPADVDGNGAVTTGTGSDLALANSALNEEIGDAGYNIDADIDRDGMIDTADTSLISSRLNLPAGSISDDASIDSPLGYASYHFDVATHLSLARHRHYRSRNGSWLQADPAGYLGGLNRFAYGDNDPISRTDPTGLVPCGPRRPPNEFERTLCCAIWEALNVGGTFATVVCCNGYPITCVDSRDDQPNLPPNPGADDTIRDCARAHEELHIPDATCSGVPDYHPAMPRPGVDVPTSECHAHMEEVQCLRNAICFGNAACQARIDQRLRTVQRNCRSHCRDAGIPVNSCD